MEQKKSEMAEMKRGGEKKEMRRRSDRARWTERKWIERLWRKVATEEWKGTPKVMVCFGGSLVDVCRGPVLQRGGALRRINGRGLWRGEAKGKEGESGPLWQGAISHPLTQAHSLT